MLSSFQFLTHVQRSSQRPFMAINFFNSNLNWIFFSRTRRRAAYLCIKRKKGWSNYNRQHITLDQSEGCKLSRLLQKKSLGPDHTAPNVLNLLNHPSWVQGIKPLIPSKPPKQGFILEILECPQQIWGHPIKDTCIPMFPESKLQECIGS